VPAGEQHIGRISGADKYCLLLAMASTRRSLAFCSAVKAGKFSTATSFSLDVRSSSLIFFAAYRAGQTQCRPQT